MNNYSHRSHTSNGTNLNCHFVHPGSYNVELQLVGGEKTVNYNTTTQLMGSANPTVPTKRSNYEEANKALMSSPKPAPGTPNRGISAPGISNGRISSPGTPNGRNSAPGTPNGRITTPGIPNGIIAAPGIANGGIAVSGYFSNSPPRRASTPWPYVNQGSPIQPEIQLLRSD